MEPGTRAEWFSVFEVWFAARFRAEFPDADWIFLVNDPLARVIATPRGRDAPMVTAPMPPDFLALEPYVAAAMVAVKVRVKAEQLGLVPRRRSKPSQQNSGEFQFV